MTFSQVFSADAHFRCPAKTKSLALRIGGFRQVEDILHGVELHHIHIGLFPLRNQRGAPFLVLIGNELEEDQRENDVLVFRRLARIYAVLSRL